MGATFPRLKTWIAEVLYATDLNAEFNNILTNLTPAGVDDQSTNDAAMQATADPYPAAAIDKPTDLKGELERLRYVIKQITGEAQWYIDPDQDISTAGTMTKANFTTPGQFTSSVATGTAPLVVSSTTEVANLKAATASTATITLNIVGNTEYSATAASDAVNIDVGTVTAGDRMLVTCNASSLWSVLPTYEWYTLQKLGGSTAVIQIGHANVYGIWNTHQTSATTRDGAKTMLVKVTTGGTLTLLSTHSASGGTNTSYASSIHVLFLNRT